MPTIRLYVEDVGFVDIELSIGNYAVAAAQIEEKFPNKDWKEVIDPAICKTCEVQPLITLDEIESGVCNYCNYSDNDKKEK